jgi:hypothetical protein
MHVVSYKYFAELRDFFVYYQPEGLRYRITSRNKQLSLCISVEYFNTLDQESPILVEHVRKNLWVTPSPKHVPLVLKRPNDLDHTEGQLPAYMDVFGNKVY